MRTHIFFVLGAFVLGTAACVPTGMSTGSATPATIATTSPPPSSGGATVDTSEPIAHGQTVQGLVVRDVPRYYRIDLQPKEALQLSFYAQSQDPWPYATIAVMDKNAGSLAEELLAVNHKTDWDVTQVNFEAKEAGTYIVRADCHKCSDQRVSYKIVVK